MEIFFKWTALVFAMGCFFSGHAQSADRTKCLFRILYDQSAKLDTSASNWMLSNLSSQESCAINPEKGGYLMVKEADVLMVCFNGDCNKWVFDSKDVFWTTQNEYYHYFLPNYHLENPLQITAFHSSVKNDRMPAMVGILNFKQWSADGSSLQQGLNAIPGVMMESRGQGGSPRMNIRGSMLRSTFGVRNVRMYFNGFALTSPDGTTPMETVDPMWVKEAEVVKGPASVEYGNGTGGVILMKGIEAPERVAMVKSSLLMGSWGYYRIQHGVNVPMPAAFHQRQLSVSFVQAATNGYREQESNERTQFLVVLNKKIKASLFDWYRNDSSRSIGRNISQFQYHKGQWGLPGSLNAKEVQTNRQMARPFSLSNNARLERERWMMGFGQDREWNAKCQAMWRVSYQFSDKENPYGTSNAFSGYKDETNQGVNIRANLNYTFLEKNNWSIEWKVGGERQQENFRIDEYSLNAGERGNLKYHYNINYTQSFIFSGIQTSYKDVLLIQLGSAIHETQVKLKGVYGSNEEEIHDFNWKPGPTPRFAGSLKWAKNQYVFANYGSGFSNPNVFEQVDYTQQRFNNQLKPELGNQLEFGWKGEVRSVEWQIARYMQKMKGVIIPGSDDASVPFTYINGGGSNQNGIEFVLQYHFDFGRNAMLHFNGWINGAKSDYSFREFQFNGNDYSNNVIPGTPLHTAQAGVDIEWNEKLQLTVSDQWLDKMPLNYEGTVWSNPYHLMQVRLMGSIYTPRQEGGGMFSWHWTVGVNNALNAQYSSFHQLNDANGRFYNPSPVRNFYVGLSAYVHRQR